MKIPRIVSTIVSDKPSFLFRVASKMTVGIVGLFSRLLIGMLSLFSLSDQILRLSSNK